MEFVEGVSLTSFANDHTFSLPATLNLFASVCDAADHAHRRGVVHRDLKPGNILVPASGQPKILDFGVARLTGADRPDHTLTSVGQIIGTIGYMSPEQVDGDPRKIDHRSDIYALGAILYELVSGRPALDFAGMSLAQAALALRDREAVPLGRVDERFRGDIEAVVAKALEKKPEARYASAGDLAADIQRHLANEPVLARPQTTWYQARKFARRHRALVAGACATFLALVLGAGGTTWQAVKATRERDAAAAQSRRARQSAALLARMVQAATPAFAQGTEPTVREMLNAAARDLERDDAVYPAVAGDTHRVIAEAMTSLGDFRRAETHARRAVALHTQSLGPEDISTLEDEAALSKALAELGQSAEAMQVSKSALDASRRLHGPDHPISIELIGAYAHALSSSSPADLTEAIKLHREWYERSQRVLGPTDQRTLIAESDLGVALMDNHEIDEAEKLLRDVLTERQELLGEDHPDTIRSMNNLVAVLNGRADLTEAAEMATRLVERATHVLGADHPSTLAYEGNLVSMLGRLERYDEALTRARHVYEAGLAKFGPSHDDVLAYRGRLVNMLLSLKKVDEAEPLVREQYELCVKAHGERHPITIEAITLQYDLAEAKGSLPEMRAAAEKLRGTKWEGPVFEQLAQAEAEAGAKPEAKPDSDPHPPQPSPDH
jgi:tetratricopeptide (TPR) repeat protein